MTTENETTPRTSTVRIEAKEPDEFFRVSHELRLSDKQRRRFFQFGELATFELTIDENMNVTGRVVPWER